MNPENLPKNPNDFCFDKPTIVEMEQINDFGIFDLEIPIEEPHDHREYGDPMITRIDQSIISGTSTADLE